MPKDALPEGFEIFAAGTGTDWDTWYQKWWNKGYFAYGPRSNHWWARWREFPKVLFAIKGSGYWRWENTDGTYTCGCPKPSTPVCGDTKMYLSAIQYWTKWHFAILWPLHIQFSYYIDDVPPFGEKAGNRRVVYFRIGARRDADKVYWFPSLFLGLQWN